MDNGHIKKKKQLSSKRKHISYQAQNTAKITLKTATDV